MPWLALQLANADPTDPSPDNAVLVLVGLIAIAVIGMLAALLVRQARVRRHPRAESILTLTFFWAILTAGFVIHTAVVQLNWQRQRTLQVNSGYDDPLHPTGAPGLPWLSGGLLVAGYLALLLWAVNAPRSGPTEESAEERSA